MLNLRMLRYADWRLLISSFILFIVGLLLIYSATSSLLIRAGSDPWIFAVKQIKAAGLGFVLLAAFLYFDYLHLRRLAWGFYLAVLFLLAMVLIVGTTAQGAQRWLSLGPLTFQPSELAKLGLIIALARFLEVRQAAITRFVDILPIGAFLVLPFLFIFLQPDLGTALVLVFITTTMLIYSGISPLILLALASPLISLLTAFIFPLWIAYLIALSGVLFLVRPGSIERVLIFGGNLLTGLAAPRLWDTLKPYQQGRILSFISPERDPLGAGYHVFQSKIAVGSGGVLGKGFLQGTQTQLQFIPEQWTDFIFSVVAEEAGLLGCLLVLGLFLIVFFRIIHIAQNSRETFGGLLAVGLGGWLASHVFVNFAMALGLAPVVGIPVPFLSYGGTSLVTTLAALGILGSIAMRGHKILF